MQDRPEQNAGYDAAVRGGPPAPTRDDFNVETLAGDAAPDVTIHDFDEMDRPDGADADDRAERDVIAEVRRRERRR